jgi:hypothetical protein
MLMPVTQRILNLFNCSAQNIAINCNRVFLSQPDGSANCLVFHAGIPLRLQNEYSRGNCEVEAAGDQMTERCGNASC